MITPRGTKTKDHNQDKPIWDAILHNQAHVFFWKKVYPPRELIYQSPPKGSFQNMGYVGSLEGTTNNESVSSNCQAKKRRKKKEAKKQPEKSAFPPQKKTSIPKEGTSGSCSDALDLPPHPGCNRYKWRFRLGFPNNPTGHPGGDQPASRIPGFRVFGGDPSVIRTNQTEVLVNAAHSGNIAMW